MADLDSLNSDIEFYYAADLETSLYKQQKIDLIFFDQQQQIIKQAAQLHQSWLVFNLENNIQQSLQYLQVGVSGIIYQLKNASKLRHVIHEIKQQNIYLEAELTQILALRQIKKIITPFNLLSSREFIVYWQSSILSKRLQISY